MAPPLAVQPVEPAGAGGWRLARLRTCLDWPIALLALMIPVGVWASADPRYSLVRAVFLVLGLASFYVTVWYAHGRESLKRLVSLYVALGTALALISLVGTDWPGKIPPLGAIGRSLPHAIRGLAGAPEGFHPNEVAGVLLWFLPAQAALWSWMRESGRAWRPQGMALAAGTLLQAAVLILSQSRGAWLGLACGLLTMGALVDRRVCMATLVLCGLVSAAAAVRGPDAVAAALSTSGAGAVVGELVWTDRVHIWRVAIQAIRDFPFTGVGLGTFRRVSPVLYALDVYPTYDIAHAHNGLLQVGVDFGLPGMGAYVAIWLVSGRLVWFSFRRARGGLRALALGLGGCLASSLVYNLTDTIALGARPGPAWWVLMGLVVATARLAQASAAGEAE